MSSVEKIKSELSALNAEYAKIKDLPPEERKNFGIEMNKKKAALEQKLREAEEAEEDAEIAPIDETAPSAPNAEIPRFKLGSKHPLMTELNKVLSIYAHMGFNIMESRQLDDEFQIGRAHV